MASKEARAQYLGTLDVWCFMAGKHQVNMILKWLIGWHQGDYIVGYTDDSTVIIGSLKGEGESMGAVHCLLWKCSGSLEPRKTACGDWKSQKNGLSSGAPGKEHSTAWILRSAHWDPLQISNLQNGKIMSLFLLLAHSVCGGLLQQSNNALLLGWFELMHWTRTLQ